MFLNSIMKINFFNNIYRSTKCSGINYPQKIKAKTKFQTLKDLFINNNNGLKELSNIKSDTFGTSCKGSIPLTNFMKQFKSEKELQKIIKKGLSTNKDGYAYSFLKTTANKPLSTSFVHDCSVMYLYNENKNTHFLYHIFPQTPKKEIDYMIKNFMPEGYTHASIVPGSREYTNTHKEYLPNVFNSIKNINNNAIINVYHNSSFYPEVVGYKGKMYEIMNKEVAEQVINKGNILTDYGQATFNIKDIHTGNTIIKIHYTNTSEELEELRQKFNKNNEYTKEIKKILNKLIDERKAEIKKIENHQSIKELDKFLETKDYDEYIRGWIEHSHHGYSHIIKTLKDKLKLKIGE